MRLPGRLHRGFRAPRLALSALLVAAVWLLPAPAPAQRFAPDPVEALREALRQDRDPMDNKDLLKYREDTLNARQKAIVSLGDLSRALLLQEWSGQQRAIALMDIDDKVYKELTTRFKAGAEKALERGDPTVKRATALLLAETAVTARASGRNTGEVQALVTSLAPSLAKASTAPEPGVREAAARSLGLVNPTATVALPALDAILSRDDAGPRRAAAEALVNLGTVSFRTEREPAAGRDPDVLRKELAEMGTGIVTLAGKVLSRPDPDPVVRRVCVDAMQVIAFGLWDAIIIPVTLQFPPKDRKVWTETEKDTAKRELARIEEELKELEPLLKALLENVGPLARMLNDRDPLVRLGAARAFEEMAAARDKIQARRASVPPIPPDPKEEKKDDKESKEKNDARAPAGRPAGLTLVLHQAPVPAPPPGAARALAQALDALRRALKDPDVRVRLAAVDALELFGKDAAPAVKALAGALADPDHFVRWAAARTLSNLAPVEPAVVVPALIVLLCDPDLDVRLAATAALERYGPEAASAVPALAKLIGKGDAEMRVAVITSLRGIGLDSAAAIPELIKALGHEDARVRRAAADLLGQFGRDRTSAKGKAAATAAEAAVPALRRLLEDPDPEVRRAASDALLLLVPA